MGFLQPQNLLIQTQLERALGASKELSRRGISVLDARVDAFGATPTLVIASHPKCNELRGRHTVEKLNGRKESFMSAAFGGCRIIWKTN